MTFIEAQDLALRYCPTITKTIRKPRSGSPPSPNCRLLSSKATSVPPLGKPTVWLNSLLS